MQVIKSCSFLFLILCSICIAQADTGIDGSAVTTSSFTMVGLVSISTLTTNTVTSSTVSVSKNVLLGPGSSNNAIIGDYRFTTDSVNARYAAIRSMRGSDAAHIDLRFLTMQGDTEGITERMQITPAGQILQPFQPSFMAYNSATDSNVTGDGTSYTVLFDTVRFNQGGDYASGTGTFTAPVTGEYVLCANVELTPLLAAHTTRNITITTSNQTYTIGQNQSLAQTYLGLSNCVLADMDTNDTAFVTAAVSGSTKTVGVSGSSSGETTFSGTLAN